ncbi:MAG: hypothetical protein OCD02_24005 [Spirochaetaceae bacterium]
MKKIRLIVISITIILESCISIDLPYKIDKEFNLAYNEYSQLIANIETATSHGTMSLKAGKYYVDSLKNDYIQLSKDTTIEYSIDFYIQSSLPVGDGLLVIPELNDFYIKFSKEVILKTGSLSIAILDIDLNNEADIISKEVFNVKVNIGRSLSHFIILKLINDKNGNLKFEDGIKHLYVKDFNMNLKPESIVYFDDSILVLGKDSSVALKDVIVSIKDGSLIGSFSANLNLKEGTVISGGDLDTKFDKLSMALAGTCNINKESITFNASGVEENYLSSGKGYINILEGNESTMMIIESVNLGIERFMFHRDEMGTSLTAKLIGYVHLDKSDIIIGGGFLSFDSADLEGFVFEIGVENRIEIPSFDMQNAIIVLIDGDKTMTISMTGLKITDLVSSDWENIHVDTGNIKFNDVTASLSEGSDVILMLNSIDGSNVRINTAEGIILNPTMDNTGPPVIGIESVWDNVIISPSEGGSLQLKNTELSVSVLEWNPMRANINISTSSPDVSNIVSGKFPIANLGVQLPEANFLINDKTLEFEIPQIIASMPYVDFNSLLRTQIPDSKKGKVKGMHNVIKAIIIAMNPVDALRLERFRIRTDISNIKSLHFIFQDGFLNFEGKIKATTRFLATKTHIKVKIFPPKFKTWKSQVELEHISVFVDLRGRVNLQTNIEEEGMLLDDFKIAVSPETDYVNINDFPNWIEEDLLDIRGTIARRVNKLNLPLSATDLLGDSFGGLGTEVYVIELRLLPELDKVNFIMGIRGKLKL